MTGKQPQTNRYLAVLVLLLCTLVLLACVPVMAVRELAYRSFPERPIQAMAGLHHRLRVAPPLWFRR